VQSQDFARSLGAEWAGSSLERPPEPVDAAIIFAPAGELVLAALASVAKGGTVVCAGIHMSEIPAFPYELLWEQRSIRSVANLTRDDGEEFMALAPQVPVHTQVETFPLTAAKRPSPGCVRERSTAPSRSRSHRRRRGTASKAECYCL
jgi:propanol-preferring alcohol dehydrogenase